MSPETPLSAANRVARAEPHKQAEPDAAIHTEHLSLSHRYEYGPTCLVLPQLFSMCFHCDVNQPTRLATESNEAHRQLYTFGKGRLFLQRASLQSASLSPHEVVIRKVLKTLSLSLFAACYPKGAILADTPSVVACLHSPSTCSHLLQKFFQNGRCLCF